MSASRMGRNPFQKPAKKTGKPGKELAPSASEQLLSGSEHSKSSDAERPQKSRSKSAVSVKPGRQKAPAGATVSDDFSSAADKLKFEANEISSLADAAREFATWAIFDVPAVLYKAGLKALGKDN